MGLAAEGASSLAATSVFGSMASSKRKGNSVKVEAEVSLPENMSKVRAKKRGMTWKIPRRE